MSLSKARLRIFRSLLLKKPRSKEGRFLAEGVRVVREALHGSAPIECVVQSAAAGEEAATVGEEARAAGVERVVLEEGEFATLASTRHTQGVLAVVRWEPADPGDLLRGKDDLLLLDAVQDPGNAGTLIRCARAFDMGGVLVGRGTVDPTDPKVVRAAAGAHFALPIARPEPTPDLLARGREAGYFSVVADSRRGEPFDAAEYPPRLVVVLGNEGRGVGPGVAAAADRTVRIPLLDGADSINVAVASGILLYHIRSRRTGRESGPQTA